MALRIEHEDGTFELYQGLYRTCTVCRQPRPVAWFKTGRARKCNPCREQAPSGPDRDTLRARRWVQSYRKRARALGFEPVDEYLRPSDVITRYGDACFRCGGPFEHLDHYPVAVSLGGHHTLDNVRPSCQSCNIRNGHRIRYAMRSNTALKRHYGSLSSG